MEQNNKLKMDFDNISIPEEIDNVILAAIGKGKRKMKRKRLFKSTIISAAACFTAFAISVNTIPAFADQFNNMPILSHFVKVIKLDEGLKGAADEGLLNSIQQSSRDKNIEFGIDNVISDGKYITISYTLNEVTKESSYSSMLHPLDYSITDDKGNILYSIEHKDGLINVNNLKLTSGGGTYAFNSDETDGGMHSFKWKEPSEKIPEKMFFVCSKIKKTKTKKGQNSQDWETSEITGKWSVPFKVDLAKETKPKIYKDIEITTEDNMKLSIDVEIYPTLTEAKVVCETGSDYDFDLFLVDDNGNMFDAKGGGTKTKDGVKTWMQGFESCYYSDYKSLYLVARRQGNNKEFQQIFESLNKYNESQLKKVKDSESVTITTWGTKDRRLDQIEGLDEINVLNENGDWIKKDHNGNILWKEPVHLETLFKVKLN